MAFQGNFSVSQSINTPGTFTLTDTSTGSDLNLTARKIYLYKYDGTTVVPSTNPAGQTWIDWAIANSSITLTNIITQDYDFNIEVDWVSSSPDPAGTYTKTELTCFTNFSETSNYGYVQQWATNQGLINDNNFFLSMIKLRVFIENAKSATTYEDIQNGQLSLNAAYQMISNPTEYFY